MLHKTQGIVLGTSPYSDVYSITHVFTRDFGRVSYLLPKSHGKKARIKTSLFFPLSVLNMEVEHLPLRDIQRLKDTEIEFPVYDIYTNMTKVAIAFFLSEFLLRVLRESDDNESTYDFVKNSIETLEAAEKGLGNFHLVFMLRLTRFLGIYPNVQSGQLINKNSYFDMLHGEFVMKEPLHSHYLDRQQSTYLSYFYRMSYNNMHLFKLSRDQRNIIVGHMLTYYRLHLYNFPHLKSLDVLRKLI